jgi:hypothetical protein
MIGYKLGLLFLQKNWEQVHNSDRNVKKKRKCVERYAEKNAET